MPAKRKVTKEEPSVKTVKESWRPSELLMMEVCQPIKDKIDQIEICKPQIVERRFCFPDIICKPWIICSPDLWCSPRRICKPDIICSPITCFPVTPYDLEWICGPSTREIPETIRDEMKDVLREIEKIKTEIAELKKSIR